MNMDNDSDIFGVRMPQKILQKISQDDYAAIDYPFSLASNNSSSDFVEVEIFLLYKIDGLQTRCIVFKSLKKPNV